MFFNLGIPTGSSLLEPPWVPHLLLPMQHFISGSTNSSFFPSLLLLFPSTIITLMMPLEYGFVTPILLKTMLPGNAFNLLNTDFTSYELKWTIDAILQHKDFYPTTENPCVVMRVNRITKSCDYIIIYHDELYIALTTLEEILHIAQEKYKIKINPHVYQLSNFPYDPGATMIC